ncbi:MAG: choice-of-anchor D domain-containing protein, partial [Paludibacteraceae bacterium]|nr:choice-of-anchor D domain-containing protein [Paludibacteraceae bacterium]
MKNLYSTSKKTLSRFSMLAVLLFSFIVTANAQAVGDYRSNGAVTCSSSTNWQRWDGSAWVNAGSSPGNGISVTIQSGHTFSPSSGKTWNNLTIQSGASVITGTSTITINTGGTVNNQGTITSGALNVYMTGAGNLGGTFSELRFNTSGITHTAIADVNIITRNGLNNGKLNMGSYNYTLGSAANLYSGTTGTAAFSATCCITTDGVDGSVAKTFSGSGSVTLPIGTLAGAYTPVTLNPTATVYGTISVTPVATAEPNTNAPTTDQINRHWVVEETGFTGISALTATTVYADADISGTEASYVAGIWDGSTWTQSSTVTTATNIVAYTCPTTTNTTFNLTAGEPANFSVVAGPELNVMQGATNMVCGGTAYDFGSIDIGNNGTATFTIQNTGTADLTISSSSISPADYTITSSYTSPVAAGGSTTVTVRFAPGTAGTITGSLVLNNDDTNEGACSINFTGVGVTPACVAGTPAIAAAPAQCGGTVNLAASGTPAADDEWFWQTTSTGTSIASPASSTYPVTVSGTYYLRAYNSVGLCWGPAASRVVTIDVAPISNAGTDITFTQNATNTQTTTLAATAPSGTDTGAWTIVSGGTGTFSASTSATSTFTPTAAAYPATYVLRWTVTNSCGSVADDVTVTVNEYVAPVNPASCYSETFESIAPTGSQTCASNPADPLGMYLQTGSSTTKCDGKTLTTASGAFGGASSSFAATSYVTHAGSRGIFLYRNSTFSFPNANNAKKLSFYIQAKSPSNSLGNNRGFSLLINGSPVTAGVTINGVELTGGESTYPILEVATSRYLLGNSFYLVEYDLTAYPSATIAISTGDDSNSDMYLDDVTVTCAPELNVRESGVDVPCGGTIDFGTTPLGTPVSKTIVVQNVGGETMNIASMLISPSVGFTITSVVPITIAGSSAANVTVEFDPATYGTKTATLTIINDDNTDNVDETSCPIILTGVAEPLVPALEALPTPVTGLDYVVGSGPSATQVITVKGWNLALGNLTNSALTNFEISYNAGGSWVAATSAYATADFTKSVLVRLKAGLAIGNYSETITFTADGQTEDVVIAGIVTYPPPVLTVTPATLSGMTYGLGEGPSQQIKTFTISGVDLQPGDITVDAPTNFQVSTDGVNFFNSLTIAQYDLPTTQVYVRLVAGLSEATYSGNIEVYGGGVNAVDAETVAVSGSVVAVLTNPYVITSDVIDDKVCQGENVTLTVDYVSGSSYLWQQRLSGSTDLWTTIGQTTQSIIVAPSLDMDYRVYVDGYTVTKTIRAIICCESMAARRVVILDDFGTINNCTNPSATYVTASYSCEATVTGGGEYGFATDANDLATFWPSTFDHTTGNGTGAMVCFDATAAGEIAYSRTYTGLCENTIYDFSAYIKNIHTGTDDLPRLDFVLKNSGGTVLESINSGEIDYTNTWVERGISFNTGAATEVILEIWSMHNSTSDNDFALDDITFTTCIPSLDLYSDLPTLTKDEIICESTNIPITAHTPYDISDFYPTPFYGFQMSYNGGAWQDVQAASASAVYNFNAAPYTAGDIYCFRSIIAPTESIVTRIADSLLNGTNANLLACETYAISDTVCITLDPPITMGPDATITACPGNVESLTGTTSASYWSWGTAVNPEAYVARTNVVGAQVYNHTVVADGEQVYFYGWSSNLPTACFAEQIFTIDIPVITPPVVRPISFCSEATGTLQNWEGNSATYNPIPVVAGMTPVYYVDNNPVTVGTTVNPSYDTGTPGSSYYWVAYRDADGCESEREAAPVEVNNCQAMTLISAASSGDVCVGETVEITFTLENAGASDETGVVVADLLPAEFTYVSNVASGSTSYNGATGVWTVGDIASGVTETVVITATATTAGTNIPYPAYVAEVSGTTYASYAAAPADLATTVTVNIRPLPVIDLTNPGVVCPSSTTSLTSTLTTSSTAPYTYTWTNATATGTGSTADFSAPASCNTTTNVTVVVEDFYNCEASDVQTITIQDTTAPTITGSLTTQTAEGCDAGDAPAAVTTVAALELM